MLVFQSKHSIEPMKAVIQIHLQPLAQFITLSKTDFSNLPEFNHYKKNAIHQHRNRLMSHFLHQTISNQDFDKTEFGKPYLSAFNQLSFNHSHSQNNYALALSNKIKDIGVDLEDLDREVRFEALAKHAFHPNEWSRWNDLDQDKEYWFKVWTTKEAVLKASGLGIRISLNTLDTQVHPFENGGICEHPLIGVFAYHNYSLTTSMLTVAWRTERSCRGFDFPVIELIQH